MTRLLIYNNYLSYKLKKLSDSNTGVVVNFNKINRVFIFILAMTLSGCGEDIVLLTNLSEQDANEVVGSLLSGGLYAEKKTEKKGVSVIIDSKDMAHSVAILKAAGLPNKHQATMGEVFKKEGVISTPLEERARYIYALSQELEFTLSQIDSVVLARVHVVLPERVAPGQPIQPSSAAVFIKHHADLDPDVIRPRIYSMVSSSIPGLSDDVQDKISVAFVESIPITMLVKWEKLGPFTVEKTSVLPLKVLLVFYTFICLLLLAILIMSHMSGPRAWFARKFSRKAPSPKMPLEPVAS